MEKTYTIEPLRPNGPYAGLRTVIVTRSCGHVDKLATTEGAADRVGAEASGTLCLKCRDNKLCSTWPAK